MDTPGQRAWASSPLEPETRALYESQPYWEAAQLLQKLGLTVVVLDPQAPRPLVQFWEGKPEDGLLIVVHSGGFTWDLLVQGPRQTMVR